MKLKLWKTIEIRGSQPGALAFYLSTPAELRRRSTRGISNRLKAAGFGGTLPRAFVGRLIELLSGEPTDTVITVINGDYDELHGSMHVVRVGYDRLFLTNPVRWLEGDDVDLRYRWNPDDLLVFCRR